MQARAEAMRAAKKAGISHSLEREESCRDRAPSDTQWRFDKFVEQLSRDEAVRAVPKAVGLSRSAVYRINDERADAWAALARWAAR